MPGSESSATGLESRQRPGHAIELREVTKRYQSGSEVIEALKRVDFAAESGEMVAIVGPSGSGKSTLLNMLGLLDEPDEGRVFLGGRDVTDENEDRLTVERRQSIGFVFQDFYLLPTLTAVENVQLPTMYADGDRRVSRERAVDLLERVGLDDRLTHRPHPALGRAATTGGHRPFARQRAAGPPGGRADGQPRPGHRTDHPRRVHADQRRGTRRDYRGHARRLARRVHRPHGRAGRRGGAAVSLVDRYPSMMMARRNLSRNTVRSGLTALGIIIGVVAIAGIGITGVALQESATQNLGDLANQVTVSPAREAGTDVLSKRQIQDVERAVSGTGAVVVPQRSASGTVRYKTEEYSASIEAMDTPGPLYDASAGKIPETLNSGVLVGASFAEETGVGVGDTVRIDGITYHVRAVLEEEAVGGFGNQYTVVIPTDGVDTNGYSSATVITKSGEDSEAVAALIETELNDREETMTAGRAIPDGDAQPRRRVRS